MWMDTSERYGLVSRLLHWTMAYLLIWQFVVILTWRLIGDTALVRTVTSLGPDHGSVGLMIISLVVIRTVWAWINRNHRPVQLHSWSGRVAAAVHGIFYILMFAIPLIALLRIYGSGKGWEPWVAPTGVEIPWMVAPADLLHGVLAWLLSILIGGHVVMALIHRFVWKDATLRRMTSPLGKKPTTGTNAAGDSVS